MLNALLLITSCVFILSPGNNKAERFSQILMHLNFHCQNFPELIHSIDLVRLNILKVNFLKLV